MQSKISPNWVLEVSVYHVIKVLKNKVMPLILSLLENPRKKNKKLVSEKKLESERDLLLGTNGIVYYKHTSAVITLLAKTPQNILLRGINHQIFSMGEEIISHFELLELKFVCWIETSPSQGDWTLWHLFSASLRQVSEKVRGWNSLQS